ncbi:hypothetical protein [Crocosphaera sp. XPORK-15E]|uniref:hypothetical protein n=1 Tax=Crocosphaera sp. XPORK-15E TaxID=3110247 RepID=UPI002B206BC8|nr:hypothetical protein [Crocosphaera sp. XPORK-15E]MEA5536068.1 hypothetical protein [Crocosphaera sp. XPORK-15E]
MMRKSASFSLLAVATSFTALLAPAQAFTPFNLTQTFNNPTTEAGDWFGGFVSTNHTKALIGAVLDDTGATDAGSAYLFDTETGNLLHTFNNPDPQIGDLFGRSVSISSIYALIGANFDDAGAENAGSVYLFNTVNGDLLQTFNNPTPETGDEFGHFVSIDGTNALIGAIRDNTGATDAGSAYLFDTETGDLLQTFNNPTPEAGDWFGYSVSVDGTYALIGASQDNTGATNAGSAYLFNTETGDLLQTFNNPDPQSDDWFGWSVSISGTNALIGAWGDNTGATDAGVAYLFNTETGDLLKTFNNPDPKTGDQFGRSVSINGTNVLIGANGDINTGATDGGFAYLFNTETGDLIKTFNNPDPQPGDQFGNSVSISGANALIGAYRDNTGAESSGSAYLYQQQPEVTEQVPEPVSVSALLGLGLGALVAKGKKQA